MSKRKIFDMRKEEHVAEVIHIIQSDCESESGNEEADVLSENEEDNEIEAIEEAADEIENSDTDEEDVNVVSEDENYISKNGMSWSKNPPKATRRTVHNIVGVPPGLTGASNRIQTVNDAFKIFFDDTILKMIVDCTNKKAQTYYEDWNVRNPEKQKQWLPTDVDEMYSFLGVLITMGVLKAKRESTELLWSTDPMYKRDIFLASMSRTRFQQLSTFIRFDDVNTRIERRQHDKLAAIRDVFTMFVEHCKSSYNPNSHLTVDEQLVSFRGRCPFIVYMKSKPAKYGVKIWALVDVESSYAINLQVYTGKDGTTPEKNQGQRVVLDLTRCLHGGYGITTDNFFTSIPLANELYKNNLTLCGTMRKNKQGIPKIMLPSPKRKEMSSVFAFHNEITMVSYVPKKNRAVILLSNEHHYTKIEDATNDYKPDIILHYNKTKGGVDTMDKMVNEYSVKRTTRRWPYVLFLNMVDIGCINAYILWKAKNPQLQSSSTHGRRNFLLQLGKELIIPQVKRRLQHPMGLHKPIVAAMRNLVPEPEPLGREDDDPPNTKLSKRSRCQLCPRKTDRKGSVSCEICKKCVCRSHLHKITRILCLPCSEGV